MYRIWKNSIKVFRSLDWGQKMDSRYSDKWFVFFDKMMHLFPYRRLFSNFTKSGPFHEQSNSWELPEISISVIFSEHVGNSC